MIRILPISALTAFVTATPAWVQPNKRKLAEDMLAKMATIQTMKYRLFKKERFGTKYRESELEIKYRKNPFACYIYFYSPDPGIEVLYVEGQNNGKAYVNPNKKLLSLVDFDFDPYGKTMRKEEHHTLFENGLEYTRSLLKHAMEVADREGKFEEYYTLEGEVNFNGRPCYKVILEYKPFRWIPYTVKEGEDLVKIARRLFLNEYMILERNKLPFYNSVKPGQKIEIPNMFAKKVVLYIDKINLLPIFQQVYDDQGLFEEYHYKNLIINPSFTSKDFDKNNPEYHF
ncbi:MAG: DUF1571 domain-containing protein [Flavobacteriales bacterium]|nr:DUF1571 domain-containing protein [Flavobacteriales bacterium]MCX7767540.1 DUF1571 domain-containing protein [Flavobacteriales bacterium]MDW8410387.1 DUF1571 domain-containing protein [Flavobacteriales bacterium]